MKRLILTVAAALLFAAPAAMAQKVNRSSIEQKIAKSDADIADAKKNVKAATWLNRGKVYFDAAYLLTDKLFEKMPVATIALSFGEPESRGEETINGETYATWVYPYVTIYEKEGLVAAWKTTQEIFPGAVETSIEAYAKAYELDPKTADKVAAGLRDIVNYCIQVGSCDLTLTEYAAAAKVYETAFAAQSVPAYGQAEPSLLYYAGYFLTIDGSRHPESFAAGAADLNKALELDYADENGDLYYYLFHCYYGQKDADEANVLKAKEALLTGQRLFPKNDKIVEGLLQLYTTEKNVGDPAELISIIDASLAENPGNIDMWFGRGRVFYALKNYDESIASFQRVVELAPDMFEGNYYLGVFYAVKGDALNEEMNHRQYNSQSEYDTDLAMVNAVYAESLPWFERAYQIKPDDVDTVEFLKSICFRLRDEEGIMDKYNYYNTLYKQMKGLE